ncbi:MAG: hypothetical protein U0133_06525 [Gemmatimonadales bacterium]
MTFDSQPRWSPDRKDIAFLSDRDEANVWRITADDVLVTKGDNNLYASPRVDPRRQLHRPASRTTPPREQRALALPQDGGPGLSLTKTTGAPAQGRPGRLPINSLGAAFGGTGRYLWYAGEARRLRLQHRQSISQWQLAIYDRETRSGSFPRPTSTAARCAPSLPDGRWLVYGVRHDAETGLRHRDLTQRRRALAPGFTPVQRDDQESRFTRDLMPGSSFTPDSKAFVTTEWKIWKVDLASGSGTEIPFTARG